ncbi:MAG: amidase [Cyclobacteriaceae bacterium]|nr:amidase [Cyclobacteriaceae bacterium]
MIRVLPVLLLIGVAACSPATEKKAPSYQYLEEITIPQLQVGYQKGSFTIEQVVKDYLQRIEDLDKNGPALNSIIYVNPQALETAKALDAELKAGKSRGLLHGIPVIIKDNMDTHDMPTTAGATVLRDSYPPDDSYLVKKLRDAGAVIIAKANLSEWANFRADMSSSGWSGVLGQTKNPYVLDRNPCGSSSGSGVAASANLCAVAIGTETNGSIVCPSNANGLVGLKPTVGLLSRSGIIPISFTQDTAGPMGRTVTDVAITLGALVGVDSADEKTLASAGNYKPDYTLHLKADGLKGKRIGLLKNIGGYHAGVDTLMKRAVADLRAQGAEVIELDFTMERGAGGSSFTVLLYEFKDGLTRYFASLGDKARVRDLAELMAFNKKDSVELKYFDQHLLKLAHEKGTLQDKEYIDALAAMHKATRENGIDKLLKENNLHALMAPTGAPAWKTDLVDGDHFLGGSSSLAAISGYPSITVPMGFVDVLPVGVSFFSTAWQEPVLIEIAYGYERATQHRKAPKYILSR